MGLGAGGNYLFSIPFSISSINSFILATSLAASFTRT